MNILFINHEDFASNSMGHIAGFASELSSLGCQCTVTVPANPASVNLLQRVHFIPQLFAMTRRHGCQFANGRPPDIIHAWTPRERVRQLASMLLDQHPSARLVVHLEDNEDHLLAIRTGRSPAALLAMSTRRLDKLVPPYLMHPRHGRDFLARAHGITGIIDRLREHAPADKPFSVLLPPVDFKTFHPGPPDPSLRARFGLRPEEKVITYAGNVHFANRDELGSLLEAVAILNRRGCACRLLRTGRNKLRGSPTPHVLDLGFVETPLVAGLMRLADVLVQPGSPGAFNDYRLPSKVPEFFAVGRPVILPATNLALLLREGEDALCLRVGTAEEIADACQRIFGDAGLARRLGENVAAFARAHFDPRANATALRKFYESL